MLKQRHQGQYTTFNIISIFCILVLMTGCNTYLTPTTSNGNQAAQQSELPEQPKAMVTFEAHTPSPLSADQSLSVEFLDEVTGLALNATRVTMERKDDQTFHLEMPFPIGSVLKYRYVRDQDQTGYEYNSLGSQVRYRLFYVTGPGITSDIISGWKTEPLSTAIGRIQGQVAFENNNAPVINALITAGGLQTLTASDGSFMLEGLPEGLHNLVVYSLDAAFEPFQQGAVVAAELTTPALIMVQSGKMVNVTITVTPPQDSPMGLPIRLVGNQYRLGNTFADLQGGVSVVGSRAPLLAILPDGRYTISLKLPAGLDLRYKYSLGDGFWNGERAATGEIRLRQLIVPNKDIEIDDVIDTWTTKDRAPISFTVTVPPATPLTDQISIQINPYAWMSPLSMWPTGNNRWFFVLYNPLDAVNSATFRFCRNAQCGYADLSETAGSDAEGKPFSSESGEQNFDEVVDEWMWLSEETSPVVVPAATIASRGASFQAGVELFAGYHPSWQPILIPAFDNITRIGSNTIILTPTWRLTHQTPPIIEQIPGKDALWTDMNQMAVFAQQQGLGIVFHPTLRYPVEPSGWWTGADRDEGWWQSWFDRYRTYVLHHADLAAQVGAKMLIIGDDTISPALPGGTLVNGSPSGVPSNADDHWARLIAEVRSRYTGKIAWYVPVYQAAPPLPDFVAEFDFLYVQINGPLASTDEMSSVDLEAAAVNLVDSQVLPLHEKNNQPVILSLKYPSAAGALDGCVLSNEACLPPNALDIPAPSYPDVELAFDEQAEAYTAILSVVNQRPWVTGVYSVGYYPPVLLKDMSVSVRGKPAANVLWYWYPRFLGKAGQ